MTAYPRMRKGLSLSLFLAIIISLSFNPAMSQVSPNLATQPPLLPEAGDKITRSISIPTAVSKNTDLCPPLTAPTAPTVTVSTEADLRSQAYIAAQGTTILIEPGTYNLTNMGIWVNRDGAGASANGNITNAVSNWFVDPWDGNLHLKSGSLPPVDAASLLNEVTTDIDNDSRPQGNAPDIGADEYFEAK